MTTTLSWKLFELQNLWKKEKQTQIRSMFVRIKFLEENSISETMQFESSNRISRISTTYVDVINLQICAKSQKSIVHIDSAQLNQEEWTLANWNVIIIRPI